MAWFHPRTVQDRDAAQKVLLCPAGLGGREVDRAHILELSDGGARARADEASQNNGETDGLHQSLPLAGCVVVSGLGVIISDCLAPRDRPPVRVRLRRAFALGVRGAYGRKAMPWVRGPAGVAAPASGCFLPPRLPARCSKTNGAVPARPAKRMWVRHNGRWPLTLSRTNSTFIGCFGVTI